MDRKGIIFPAYAGVSLAASFASVLVSNIPRVCGGEPMSDVLGEIYMAYSPRMRG